MTIVSLVEGDIVEQAVDAVVNAANSALVPGGGVDGALTRAAGLSALEEREKLVAFRGTPPLPTGEALATSGGDLKARWIIFTAGPIYSGQAADAVLLARCHASVLRVADDLGARSVAFPAISTGVYGYPAQEAARVATAAVLATETAVSEVRFVLYSSEMFEIFTEAMEHNALARGWTKDKDTDPWRPG